MKPYPRKSRYERRPVISAKVCSAVAEAQGLVLRRAWRRSVPRWVLVRADWADGKPYLVYSRLRDVYAALQPPRR